jgi:lipopolysaccharide transport protein LptA
MPKIALSIQIILFAVMISPDHVSGSDETRLETIRISADEAYEDIQHGTLHLEGNFLMQSIEWKLESARATVYGQPDRPDEVHLEGAPARFLVTRNDADRQYTVEAEAMTIKYLRSTSMLELTGNAILKLDDEVINSNVIKYYIDSKHYWAGGEGRVMMEVPPVDCFAVFLL